jgi:hypothetical protein
MRSLEKEVLPSVAMKVLPELELNFITSFLFSLFDIFFRKGGFS